MESLKSPTLHFFAQIRHAERADNIEDPTKLVCPLKETIKDDPPLTLKGVAQAIRTGQFLLNYFQDEVFLSNFEQ